MKKKLLLFCSCIAFLEANANVLCKDLQHSLIELYEETSYYTINSQTISEYNTLSRISCVLKEFKKQKCSYIVNFTNSSNQNIISQKKD